MQKAGFLKITSAQILYAFIYKARQVIRVNNQFVLFTFVIMFS